MKSKHIVASATLLFIATVVYVTIVLTPPSSTHRIAWNTTSRILLDSSLGYTPIPVEDDESTAMGIYSSRVKSRIRDIKQNLVYRPPLSILPFVRMMGHFIVAPNYRMANCVVEKSMCTQMNSILCYLYDTEGFIADNRTIETEDWWNTYCKYMNSYSSWKDLQVSIPEPLETTFIVRDPVSRFISAFIDKCVHEKVECYGCYQNFTCVVEKVFESVTNMSKNHTEINDRRDMVMEMTYEGRHFVPLTWYCDLWDRYEEYHFIKYGEDSDSFNETRSAVLNFFKKQGVETEKIKDIEEALTVRSGNATKKTYSALRKEVRKILMHSKKHLEMMVHMYYYDYVAFGFKSPIDIYYPYS